MATGLFSTLANITAPCSVKTKGAYLMFWPRFKVAICDLEANTSPASARESWNMKCSGKRSRLRFTCSFNRFVVTPYRTARSRSSITRWPRTTKMECSIRSIGMGEVEAIPLALPDSSRSCYIVTMESVLAKHGDSLRPGDIILAKYAYCGISHMPDITLIAPAFWQERLVGFLISYSHHTDIGGRFAGGISSLCQSSFEEGVRIPMLKLYDAGRRNDTLLELIVANVRTPEEGVGDVDAKVASCWKGQGQVQKLLDKYGIEKFNSTCDYLVDYAERVTRAAIRQIPSGEYREEMLFEDENEVTGGPVPLEGVVRIEGDQATVDLSSSPPQVNASINAPLVSTKSVTRAPFKAIVPSDAITNIGFARAIEVIVPPGTLLNPRYPAAVGGRASLMMTLSNMVFRVIAKALPGRLGGVW